MTDVLRLHPSRLPELRAKAVAGRESEQGKRITIRGNQNNTYGSPTTLEAATERWRVELRTLREATLFHVSDEMSRLWFDSPIGDSTGIPIRAASWVIAPVGADLTPAVVRDNASDGVTVWLDESGQSWVCVVTFYASPDDLGESGQAIRPFLGGIIAEWERVATFGDAESSLPDGAWAALISAWLLMGQQIADVVDLSVPPRVSRKHARRKYARTPVKVVTIAPKRVSPAPLPTTGREYKHRWIVRGHWRNQWHPKQARHVPIWIDPHVKGPDGAPILDRQEIVHAWK